MQNCTNPVRMFQDLVEQVLFLWIKKYKPELLYDSLIFMISAANSRKKSKAQMWTMKSQLKMCAGYSAERGAHLMS
jgi:hypothetical protein